LPNTFKQSLLSGKRLIGCWCSLASPVVTEVLGVAGFDWILLDGEHSPNDPISFVPQLMALTAVLWLTWPSAWDWNAQS
jgi:2-dehydro-3-deoxyglucarate aldolase